MDKYVLVQDDDCHWYVCPSDKQSEASAYFVAVREFWRNLDAEGDEPRMPEYIIPVGGAPSLVKFTGFEIS